MAILNSFAGSGGGVRIPLEPASDFSVLRGNAANTLTWVDPVDKVADPGGEPVATWAYDVLVRRSDRYPTSPSDGHPVFRNTVKNQGGSGVSYTDTGLTNGVPYYYALYSYTTIGVVSEPARGTATPIGGVVYSGTTSMPLSSPDSNLASAIAGGDQYVIFGGGTNNSISAYDASLTKVATLSPVYNSGEGFSNSLGHYAGASTTGYAIFRTSASEMDSYPYDDYTVYVAYNSSLTRSLHYNRNNGSVDRVKGTSFNGYAVFSGGYNSDNSVKVTNQGQYFDNSLTLRTYTYSGADAMAPSGMASFGNYFVIGPGYYADRFGAWDNDNYFVLNTSFTVSLRGTASGEFTDGINTFTGVITSSPTHAILASGSKTVDVINTSLTKQSATALPGSFSPYEASGTTLGEFALLAGGSTSSVSVSYDHELVQKTHDGLSVPRSRVAANHIGKYALFAGGDSRDVVDVYTS